MTYPPEHTTDFDNDEWINGLDREEDIEEELTPKQKAKYWNEINLENGDYE